MGFNYRDVAMTDTLSDQQLRLHMGELTASELQVARAAIQWAYSRLDTPKTVEEVAMALAEAYWHKYISREPFPQDEDDYIKEAWGDCVPDAQAAISTIKRLAGGDITAMQNQEEDGNGN